MSFASFHPIVQDWFTSAVGVPTLGLFSVGYPQHFRPVGPNDRFLRANPIAVIDTREVMDGVEEMWATARPGFQR